jgi:hypothetical protein
MTSALLPSNSTPWERAVADAMSTSAQVEAAIRAIRGTKLTSPPASFLPFLIWEYGLGELTPYVPNLYDIIPQGIAWQRVRGTPQSLVMGLGWLNYEADLYEAPTHRRYWNAIELKLTSLPAYDDLERIEGVTSLSLRLASFFRRGAHVYDIPALECDTGRLDASMLDFPSGVRLREDGPIWSFGRAFEFDHTFLESEGVALDNWIPVVAGGGVTWADLDIPWEDADFAWNGDGTSQRAATLASSITTQSTYVVFRTALDEVIGYRRATANRPVMPTVDGVYSIGGQNYQPAEGGTFLYIAARTGFGDAKNVSAASVAVVVGGVLAEGIPPGRLWLQPGDLIGGVEIASSPVDIPFREEVREQIKILVRF